MIISTHGGGTIPYLVSRIQMLEHIFVPKAFESRRRVLLWIIYCNGPSRRGGVAPSPKATPAAPLVGWLAKLSRRKVVRRRQHTPLVGFQGNLLG